MGLSSAGEAKETAMAEPWLGIVEKVTEFFATAQIEACARWTGFVRRTAKITGKVFLAVVTLGAWGTPKTSLAQLAAKGAQFPTPVDFSPEALHQRMTRRAVVFLRELLQRAFAKLHPGDTVCDTELLPPLPPSILPIAPASNSPSPLRSSSPVVAAARASPGPSCNWCGSISATALPTWPWCRGRRPIINISTRWANWRNAERCFSLTWATLRCKPWL